MQSFRPVSHQGYGVRSLSENPLTSFVRSVAPLSIPSALISGSSPTRVDEFSRFEAPPGALSPGSGAASDGFDIEVDSRVARRDVLAAKAACARRFGARANLFSSVAASGGSRFMNMAPGHLR